jgi:hypothetical protein
VLLLELQGEVEEFELFILETMSRAIDDPMPNENPDIALDIKFDTMFL